jgi:hypothetical protein
MLMDDMPAVIRPKHIAMEVFDYFEKQKQKSFERDVFLSYATADKEQAERIRATLESRGLSCFMASKDMIGGDNFSDRIRDALLSSREVCVVCSPTSVISEWVLTESGAAWALKKLIVPILHRIDVNLLPERLKPLHAIDMADIDRYVSEVLNRRPQKE